jgi:serine/threonine protein kinase
LTSSVGLKNSSEDIKLENVMVASVTPFVIKLIDFGQAALEMPHLSFGKELWIPNFGPGNHA